MSEGDSNYIIPTVTSIAELRYGHHSASALIVLALVRRILVHWPGANLLSKMPLTIRMIMSWLTLLMLVQMILASPFKSIPTTYGLATSRGQAPFDAPENSTEFRTLQQLHEGNQKIRERLTQTKAMIVQQGLILSLSS